MDEVSDMDLGGNQNRLKVIMEKEFLTWFEANETRFAHGQFDEKSIAYSAWLEAKQKTEKNIKFLYAKLKERRDEIDKLETEAIEAL